MSELVENSLHLVDSKILFEVADIDDNGTNHLALSIDVLLADVVHPGSATLARARQIVCREDAQEIAVGIRHLIGRDDFGIIRRHVLQFLHIHAIKRIGSDEDAFHHVLELEVGLGEFFVEVIFLLAHLLGIVPPVPLLYLAAGRKFASRYVLIHQLLHVIDLLLGFRYGSCHNVGEEGINRFCVVCHLGFEEIGGRIVVAHNLCLLDAKAHDVEDELAVVELVAVVTSHGVSLKHLLAEGMVLGRGHRIGIVGDADAELLLEGVALGEDVVAQLLRLGGHLGIYLAKAGLLLLGKAYAITLKSLEALLQHHLLLTTELALVGEVELGNALIEPLVEGNVVLVLCKHGKRFLHNRVEFVRAVCLADIEQHAYNFAQDFARELERQNGVLEGRTFGIVHDGVNLLVLLLDTCFDGWDVVLDQNVLEGRNAIRRIPLGEERVLATVVACQK